MNLMDTLKQRLTALKLEAVKDSSKKENVTSLVTLIGEIDTVHRRGKGGPVPDSLVISEVVKRVNGLDGKIAEVEKERNDINGAGIDEWIAISRRECEFFNGLNVVPVQLTEDEIRAVLLDNGLLDIPSAFKYFRANYENRYNGDLVKRVVNNLNK